MKFNNAMVLLATALAAGASVHAGEKDVMNRSFEAHSGEKLYMKVDRGSIHITPGASDKVEVTVTRELKRGSAEKAQQIFDKYKIEMSRESSGVNIVAENARSFPRNAFNGLQVRYDISLPRQFNLDLHTAAGNIEAGDLEGNILAGTSGGDIKLGAISGPVDVRTSGGNISVEAAKGPVKVRTSGGNLHLGTIDGDVVAMTSGGSITVDRVKGSTEAQTSGGDIHLREALGPVLAHTSGGNVSANLNQAPGGKCALKTSGGNVAVTLSDRVAVDLSAHTSGGSVRSDFPGQLNKQKTRLMAQVNGGGPEMLLETSGGNVEIRKK